MKPNESNQNVRRCQAMELHFAGQPFSNRPTLVDFVKYATESEFDELKIAVAWAKRSGLGRIWDALKMFRDGGGKVTLILGVSEGGATKEGLELALSSSDEGYVFHDPQRTFHPKVYFACSENRKSLFVGSSNLTAGGLNWNYEASIWIDFEENEGTQVSAEVNSWFNLLLSQNDACRPLTKSLIAHLDESDDIFLGFERRARRPRKIKSSTPEDSDSRLSSTVSGLFNPIKTGLQRLPALSPNISDLSQFPDEISSAYPSDLSSPADGGKQTQPSTNYDFYYPSPLQSDVHRRWYKKMDNTAAQRVKSANSNPTGNLRLSQGSAPINHRFYFRNDFFSGLPWAPSESKRSTQEVLVDFQTWIDGDYLGLQELRVSHDPNRISGQANVPTVLHWGKVIGNELRNNNFVDFYTTLERTKSDTYNLIISKNPRGDYIT